jgi:hypothetical protein
MSKQKQEVKKGKINPRQNNNNKPRDWQTTNDSSLKALLTALSVDFSISMQPNSDLVLRAKSNAKITGEKILALLKSGYAVKEIENKWRYMIVVLAKRNGSEKA